MTMKSIRGHIPYNFLLIAVLFLFYVLPLLSWITVHMKDGMAHWPLELPFLQYVYNTLLLSSIIAMVSVCACYPVALLWRFSGYAFQGVIVFIMIVPMVMGLLARNYSWIGMLSSNHALISMGTSLLFGNNLIYTRISLCLVMICIFIPVAFFITIQGLRSVSQENLDAARTLGAPDWKIIFLIILPMSMRALVLATALVFAMASGFFVTPAMIGGRKYNFISNVILTYIDIGRFETASTLALAFLGIMIIPMSLVLFIAVRKRKLVLGN